MTKEEAIKWLKNLYSDIGKMQFQALWDYGQAIDEIIKLLSADSEWIPCSERLPSKGRYYLCCNKRCLPFIAHYFDGQWHCVDETTPFVDAWMPLPESYRKENEA